MKNHLIKLVAIGGFVAAMSSPASAEHNDLDFAIQLGSTYVTYDDGYRRFDRRHRYDRNYGHGHKYRKQRHKRRRRQEFIHERWHRHNDPRWDRYYFYDHKQLHRRLRRGHHDFYRRQYRHG